MVALSKRVLPNRSFEEIRGTIVQKHNNAEFDNLAKRVDTLINT